MQRYFYCPVEHSLSLFPSLCRNTRINVPWPGHMEFGIPGLRSLIAMGHAHRELIIKIKYCGDPAKLSACSSPLLSSLSLSLVFHYFFFCSYFYLLPSLPFLSPCLFTWRVLSVLSASFRTNHGEPSQREVRVRHRCVLEHVGHVQTPTRILLFEPRRQ